MFEELRDAIVFYNKHDIDNFLETLAKLCKSKILYQIDADVYIDNIELYVKNVLRLKYKLSASLLCLFIFVYKKKIVNGEEVIIKLNDIVRYFHWVDHGYDLMSAKSGTRRQAIQELKCLELIKLIRYKVYKFNYTKLRKGLVRIILNTTSAYYDVELPNIFAP